MRTQRTDAWRTVVDFFLRLDLLRYSRLKLVHLRKKARTRVEIQHPRRSDDSTGKRFKHFFFSNWPLSTESKCLFELFRYLTRRSVYNAANAHNKVKTYRGKAAHFRAFDSNGPHFSQPILSARTLGFWVTVEKKINRTSNCPVVVSFLVFPFFKYFKENRIGKRLIYANYQTHTIIHDRPVEYKRHLANYENIP